MKSLTVKSDENMTKFYFFLQAWHLAIFSSRLDTDSMLTSLLTWASGESETKGKGGKVCGSNLML